MEIVLAIAVFYIIATLVNPKLLSQEITIGLIGFGLFYLLGIVNITTEQALAIIVFGVLFMLVIPDLMKK